MMKKHDSRKIYDRDYAQDYNQRFLLNDLSKVDADFERETIAQLLNEIGENPRWLDVACGTGYFLSCFPEVERVGLDISSAMLEVARKTNPDILLVQGDYRDRYPQWEGKWDLVSCMWWAYGYVESLTEFEKLIANFSDWISERGICFLPICEPELIGIGKLKLPYTYTNEEQLGGYGGSIQFEGIIWTWIDEQTGKRHENMIAPQLEYIVSVFSNYFDIVNVIDYSVSVNSKSKAIVARKKKQKIKKKAAEFSLLKLTRSHDWWLYKIPPLLAIAYTEVLLLNPPIFQSILTISALLFAIACVAAYGHIINDSFDVEADQQVGKHNSMAQFSPWQRTLFCFTFAGLGFSLPVLMNFGTLSLSLLGINYLLPTLYSAPPFRFKEKDILGIISDAAGAHAIPTLFIAITLTHLVAAPPLQITALTIAATTWAFFAGLRGILLHQLWDRSDDLRSNVKTFVTESQVETVRFWMSRLLFPVEMLLLGSLILVVTPTAPLVPIFTVFYFLLKLTLTKLDSTATFDLAPVQKAYVIPHDFYEVGLPLILASILALQNPWFIILLLLHIVLFYPGFERRITNLIQFIRTASGQSSLKLTQSDSKLNNDLFQSTQNKPVTHAQTANELQITPQMQKALEDYGYVVLDNFLTDAELQDLREFDRTHPLPEDLAANGFATTAVTPNFSYRKLFSDKFKAIATSKLRTTLPGYRAVFCPWFRKKPNSGDNSFKLHQGPYFTDESRYLSLGIWCPLTDVNVENGCLYIVKGSHRLNCQKRAFYTFTLLPYEEKELSYIEDNYLTPISLKAGQAILFDRRLFHGSTANTSDTDRIAVTCLILIPNDAPLYFCYRESEKSESVEIYEVPENFYDHYIYGDRPHGEGVKLINTTRYAYDHLTPQILAEKLDSLHTETTFNPTFNNSQQNDSPILSLADKIRSAPIAAQPPPTPAQAEQIRDYLQQFHEQLRRLQSNTHRDLTQIRTEVAELQAKLAQAESAQQTSQTEAAQLRAFLHTQEPKIVADYYCHAIAANPGNLQLYEQALAFQPANAQLHLQLASQLVQQGQLDQAIAHYQSALQHCPTHCELHLALAKTLETAKRWEEALAIYRRTLELDPQSAIAYEQLGNALAEQGQLDQANTAYRRFLQLQSS